MDQQYTQRTQKKVVRKKEKEAVNARLYAYMHDIFGAEVIELFDMEYDPDQKYAKKDAKKDAEQEAKADAKSALEQGRHRRRKT